MSPAIAREVEHHMAEAAADAAVLLDEARKAWADLRIAESNLSRLRGYARLNASMRQDQDDYLRQQRQAKDTLKRVLGAAA